MKTLTFSHPKLRNIELNFGQLNQVVGNHTEQKQQLWQILTWYLSKHKYSEAELSLLDYKEPEIYVNKELLSRSAYQTLVIESMSDIHDLLTVKKGTPIFSVLQEITSTIQITENIELINQQLEIIESKINSNILFNEINEASTVSWKTIVKPMTATELLQKQVSMEVFHNKNKSSIAYEDGLEKYKTLISFLRSNLTNNVKPILLMIKNIDDSLYYNDFIYVMEQFEQLTKDFAHFHCMIFPSQIGYVYISELYIANILIIGDETHRLEDGETLYNSVCRHYPDTVIPSYSQFLQHLQIIVPYLFSNISQATFLSIKDQILIKLINQLYYFYNFIPNKHDEHTALEYNFLFSNNRD